MSRKKKREEAEAAAAAGFGDSPAPAAARITPIDIQQKVFSESKVRAGYNEREVDQFLDAVTEELARQLAENKSLREQLARAEMRPTTPLGTEAGDADAVVQQARAEASRILSSARDDAARVVADARGQAVAMVGGRSEAGDPTDVLRSGAASQGQRSGQMERAPDREFIHREREFLQSLAGLIQSHAEAIREDLKRVRGEEEGLRREPDIEAVSTKGSADPTSAATPQPVSVQVPAEAQTLAVAVEQPEGGASATATPVPPVSLEAASRPAPSVVAPTTVPSQPLPANTAVVMRGDSALGLSVGEAGTLVALAEEPDEPEILPEAAARTDEPDEPDGPYEPAVDFEHPGEGSAGALVSLPGEPPAASSAPQAPDANANANANANSDTASAQREEAPPDEDAEGPHAPANKEPETPDEEPAVLDLSSAEEEDRIIMDESGGDVDESGKVAEAEGTEAEGAGSEGARGSAGNGRGEDSTLVPENAQVATASVGAHREPSVVSAGAETGPPEPSPVPAGSFGRWIEETAGASEGHRSDDEHDRRSLRELFWGED